MMLQPRLLYFHCERLPMAVRCVVDQALASLTSASQQHHPRAGVGFVYEDQSFRVERALLAHRQAPAKSARCGSATCSVFVKVTQCHS